MRSQGRRSQHKEKTEEKEKKKTAVAPNNVPSRPSRLSHRVQLNYTPAAAPPPAYIVIFIVYFSPHPPSPPLYGHAQRPAEEPQAHLPSKGVENGVLWRQEKAGVICVNDETKRSDQRTQVESGG
uniref:Uncharacterized protein n=1 Tax=Bursaphelenchus xylophilus TaxID=6326 RepID=A0A1I7S8M4_BURXY